MLTPERHSAGCENPILYVCSMETWGGGCRMGRSFKASGRGLWPPTAALFTWESIWCQCLMWTADKRHKTKNDSGEIWKDGAQTNRVINGRFKKTSRYEEASESCALKTVWEPTGKGGNQNGNRSNGTEQWWSGKQESILQSDRHNPSDKCQRAAQILKEGQRHSLLVLLEPSPSLLLFSHWIQILLCVDHSLQPLYCGGYIVSLSHKLRVHMKH